MLSKKIVTVPPLAAPLAAVTAFGLIASLYLPAAFATKVVPNANSASEPILKPSATPSDASASERRAPKKAMTWTLKSTSGSSALFGRHGTTNAYQGDTPITERRSLLCVSKEANLSKPKELVTGEYVSSGGANVATWSKRQAFAIPDVLGSSLTSESVADGKCAAAGSLIYGNSGFRMAEHHDGTGSNPGWGFWGQAYGAIQGIDQQQTVRYWVKIKNQPANPW